MLLILLALIICKPEFIKGFVFTNVLSIDRLLWFPILLTYKNYYYPSYEPSPSCMELIEFMLYLNMGPP
jgi:hypothetical protein